MSNKKTVLQSKMPHTQQFERLVHEWELMKQNKLTVYASRTWPNYATRVQEPSLLPRPTSHNLERFVQSGQDWDHENSTEAQLVSPVMSLGSQSTWQPHLNHRVIENHSTLSLGVESVEDPQELVSQERLKQFKSEIECVGDHRL